MKTAQCGQGGGWVETFGCDDLDSTQAKYVLITVTICTFNNELMTRVLSAYFTEHYSLFIIYF